MFQYPIQEHTLEEWKSKVKVDSYTAIMLARDTALSLKDSLELPTGAISPDGNKETSQDTKTHILELTNTLQYILGEAMDTTTAMFPHKAGEDSALDIPHPPYMRSIPLARLRPRNTYFIGPDDRGTHHIRHYARGTPPHPKPQGRRAGWGPRTCPETHATCIPRDTPPLFLGTGRNGVHTLNMASEPRHTPLQKKGIRHYWTTTGPSHWPTRSTSSRRHVLSS